MIIDADCHIAADPVGFAIGIDDLIRLMDHHHVDKAVCWPMVSYTRAIAPDNTAIAAGASQYPDRIVPFGGVNPRLGMEAALAEVQRCATLGFHGVKLNGARDQYLIDDPDLSIPVIEAIAAQGLMLALHIGANDYVRTHPYRAGKIARAFPHLPIMMVHMGGVGREHLHREAIEFAAEHDNLFLGTSKADPAWVRIAIETLGAARVCYASDTPFQDMRYPLATHVEILRGLPEHDQELVMGGNMRNLLNL